MVGLRATYSGEKLIQMLEYFQAHDEIKLTQMKNYSWNRHVSETLMAHR